MYSITNSNTNYKSDTIWRLQSNVEYVEEIYVCIFTLARSRWIKNNNKN